MDRAVTQQDLDSIRSLLRRWGNAVRAQMRGYPAMSSHEKLRSGAGVMAIDYALAADLQAVEDLVNQAPVEHKSIVIEAYTKFGTGDEHAARLGISRQEFYKRRRGAELYLAARV